LNAEAQKEVPAYETMFATALTCALLKHTAVTQGTDNAFRVQVLIAALLPLVRVDLARAIEFEFKQEGERA
jgi:hypothetical protein